MLKYDSELALHHSCCRSSIGHVARMGDSQDTSRALYVDSRVTQGLEAPPRTSTSDLATDHGSRPPAAQSRSDLSLATRSGPRTMEATCGHVGMPAMMMMMMNTPVINMYVCVTVTDLPDFTFYTLFYFSCDVLICILYCVCDILLSF